MSTRASRRIALIALIAAVCVPAAAAALPLDASLPAPPASPATVPVSGGAAAVYRVSVGEAETLNVSVTPAAGSLDTLDVDVYLYGPSATVTDHAAPLAHALNGGMTMYPETLAHIAAASGDYYLEVFAAEGSGEFVLTWSVAPEPLLPVYRFYHLKNGTHFYTPSDAEKAQVEATLSGTYRYEGPAYYTRATQNSQELYRFFNRKNGSHFYTADPVERDAVKANLSATYSYDGPTYKVSPVPAEGKAPVYRFYNIKSGSHFYTADESEKQRVLDTLGTLYVFEGPVFWLGR